MNVKGLRNERAQEETFPYTQMSSEAVRAKIFVSGKVQGVYYRDSCVKKGTMLGLSGRAWNLADGRVEIHCEGPKAQLSEFEKWCRKGPEGAEEVGLKNSLTKKRRVDKVEVEYVMATGAYSDFKNGGKR